MQNFLLNFSNTIAFFSKEEFQAYSSKVSFIHTNLLSISGKDTEWLDFTMNISSDLIKSIKTTANEIKANADIFLIIGIGGSYLGSRAIIDALTDYFPQKKNPEIIYVGNNLSGTYLNQLLKYIHNKSVYINVISKSGATTEPAIAFRILKQFLEQRYGTETKKRIFVTTDGQKSLLKDTADINNYQRFEIPQNIGGRYSVFTPVGLLPIAVAGIDIELLLSGVNHAIKNLNTPILKKNPAYQYAVIRNLLYQKGYTLELLTVFEPSLKYFQEWWKQLFGESEGKDLKGIFPADVSYPTDLHSFGQYVQDGKRQLFETMVSFNNLKEDFLVPASNDDLDQLNYLANRSLNEINQISKQGTILAHSDGNVPIFEIELANLDAYHLGYVMFFFMKACAMSSYLLGVNPFNQPGVESYKKNMQDLLAQNDSLVK